MKYPLPVFLLATLSAALAAPHPESLSSSPVSIPILRKRTPERNSGWFKAQKEKLHSKYGGASSSTSKRAVGVNELVNQNTDSSYYGTLAVGTPPLSYNVILDTGSADFWLASEGCKSCRNVAIYDPTASSTFRNSSKKFSIQYGSGNASGILGQDTVQMAGFKVEQQIFASVSSVSSGLLTPPVSGLLGLAFQTIATSGATPFWEALVKSGAWDQPVFSFYLSRFIDDPNASNTEPGGQFMLGGTNSSLYSGDIDFVDIPDGLETYWVIPIKTMTVQGNELVFPNTKVSQAAIDTGTTLVGGPPDAIASIYAQIPSSFAGVGEYESYWFYPCATEVNISISFGGRTWSINPQDFMLAQVTRTQCVGAFFELPTGSGAPSWIIGDTFLKNVYSVYRYSPPSIGFAQLSTGAQTLYEAGDPLPAATIGASPATVTGSSDVKSSGAVSLSLTLRSAAVAFISVVLGAVLL